VVFASVSTLTNPPHAVWWEILRWGSFICGITAIALAWNPGAEARIQQSFVRTIAYQLATRVGSAKVIFSIVFLLALISYFDLQRPESKLFVITWAIFVLTAFLDIPQLLSSLVRFRGDRSRNIIGVTHSFLAPTIVYCERIFGAQIPIHQIVGFCQSAKSDFHTYGLVIGNRASASENRIVVALLDASVDENELNSASLLASLGETEVAEIANAQVLSGIESAKKIVGTVAKGSNISQLRFEIFGKPSISAGSLLQVRGFQGQLVYYQAFEGVVDEEETLKDSARAFVEGRAEQVGCWENERGGFETHDWVAPERSCVHLVDTDDPAPNYELDPTEKKVGVIPHSRFPVIIDLNDLVLYHAGILGVTGSGKSFLTFSLIESCAANGIKVVCVDPTGDYQRYLGNAVILTQGGSLQAFLDSPDHWIGIIETGRSAMHPIRQANVAASACLAWCKEHRSQEEILVPKSKLLVIFEEAHLLVPEWNFNPERELQNVVNGTSQTVLQARKYGLGFLVVSQRTANVVKSILNQCNTIFSFQAFDETGFEFLKNYMGSFHVRSLPNLKVRHGIVVGKASKSRRPIMVHFEEQARELQSAPAPDMLVTPQQHGASTTVDLEAGPEVASEAGPEEEL
jgi:hypothetical protein